MKNGYAYLVAGLLLSCASLGADLDLNDASGDTLESIPQENQGPFTLSVSGDWIAEAKIRRHHGGHLQYSHAEANAEAVVWYNECYKEAVQLGVGYEYTRLDWNRNPFFERKNYPTFTLSTVFLTHRLCDWRWIASVNYNLDADKWNFNEYSTWDMLLWGRYDYLCDVGLHIGIYAETGMKLDRVWPVIGFDWQISQQWKLNAVFPVNMDLTYTINECWNVALALRTFSDRHRAGNVGYYPKAVWRYTNGGVEAAVNNISLCGKLKANAHVGYSVGGRLRIANRHDHHVHHRDFDGAFYASGQLSYNF